MQISLTSIIALLIGTSVVQAQSFDPALQLPANANTAWVSKRLNHNGLVLSIQTFHSPDSVNDVFEFYRTLWFSGGEIPGFVESTVLDWKLISSMRENINTVLQLKETDTGSTGFLSMAQLNSNAKPIEIDFPQPDYAELYSSTSTSEAGVTVSTMTLITKLSIAETVAFYRDELVREGWSVSRYATVKGSELLLLNRKEDRIELAIKLLDNKDTVIFINQVNQNDKV